MKVNIDIHENSSKPKHQFRILTLIPMKTLHTHPTLVQKETCIVGWTPKQRIISVGGPNLVYKHFQTNYDTLY
jgi:hypothetical protein